MKIARIYANTKAALMARTATAENNKQFFSVMGVVAVGAFALMPDLAMAAPWDGAAQGLLDMLTGGLARTIAIIAVIACGFAALAGKLSWDWAIKIVVGIVLIFGAATIVDYFIGVAA